MPLQSDQPFLDSDGRPDPLDERRAKFILADIYNRHGYPFDPDARDPDAMQKIIADLERKDLNAGWRNEAERADKRKEYTRQQAAMGEDPHSAWDRSQYVLDPRTYRNMQEVGRDLDFVRAMQSHYKTHPVASADLPADAYVDSGLPDYLRPALKYWDRSNHSGVSNQHALKPNYARRTGGVPQDGLLDELLGGSASVSAAFSNNTNPVAQEFRDMSVTPNALRVWFNKDAGLIDAHRIAAGLQRVEDVTLPYDMSPVLHADKDTPDKFLPLKRYEFDQRASALQPPQAEERWQFNPWFGVTDPHWSVKLLSDLLLDSADYTLPFTALGLVGGAMRAMKARNVAKYAAEYARHRALGKAMWDMAPNNPAAGALRSPVIAAKATMSNPMANPNALPTVADAFKHAGKDLAWDIGTDAGMTAPFFTYPEDSGKMSPETHLKNRAIRAIESERAPGVLDKTGVDKADEQAYQELHQPGEPLHNYWRSPVLRGWGYSR